MKKAFLGLALFTSLASGVWSHDMWLKPSGAQATLIYGHGDDESPYSPRVVKRVTGMSSNGDKIQVKLVTVKEHCVVRWPKEAIQVGAEVDTGFWVKTVDGWKNVSKQKVESYLQSDHSVMYSKLLVKPEATVGKSFGYEMELIPTKLSAESVTVKLNLRGKPLPKIPIFFAHDKIGETDAAGQVTVKRQKNLILSATYREPLKNDKDADELKLTSVLTVP